MLGISAAQALLPVKLCATDGWSENCPKVTYCLSLNFMRFRHEANKEKENSIDQDLEVFSDNCSSVNGRKHELFMESRSQLPEPP